MLIGARGQLLLFRLAHYEFV